MKTIIFCHTNKRDDIELADILHRNLTAHYQLTVASPYSMSKLGSGEPLLMLETDKLPECEIPDAIFLFGEHFYPDASGAIIGSPLCIAASDNHDLLQAFAGSGAHFITCGMSPKDTFSCSGKNESSASVSLMREIVGYDGNRIEPFELVFTLPEEISAYNLLAYAAVLTLFGNITESAKSSLIIR